MSQPERLRLDWREPAAVAELLTNHFGPAGLVWLDGDGSALGRHTTTTTPPIANHPAGITQAPLRAEAGLEL